MKGRMGAETKTVPAKELPKKVVDSTGTSNRAYLQRYRNVAIEAGVGALGKDICMPMMFVALC